MQQRKKDPESMNSKSHEAKNKQSDQVNAETMQRLAEVDLSYL